MILLLTKLVKSYLLTYNKLKKHTHINMITNTTSTFEKSIYKRLLEKEILESLPKYITNNTYDKYSYYNDICQDIFHYFDISFHHSNLITKSQFMNGVLSIFVEYEEKNNISGFKDPYLHILKKGFLIAIDNSLYNDNNLFNEYQEIIHNLENHNLKNNIQKRFKKTFDNNKYFEKKAKIALQELREKYFLETIVSQDISWKDTYTWAKNIDNIIQKSQTEMNIPTQNIIYKNITLICSSNKKHTTGYLDTSTNNNHYIKVAFSNPVEMFKIWIHEFTHELDCRAGFYYSVNNLTSDEISNLNSTFLSDIALQYKFNLPEHESEVHILLNSVNKLVKFSLGLENSDTKNFNTNEKIKRISDYFFHLAFEKNNLNWTKLNLENNLHSYLVHTNHYFSYNLIRTAYASNYNQIEDLLLNIASEKPSSDEAKLLKKGIEKFKSNLFLFSESIKLTTEQIEAISQTFSNIDFLKEYIEHAKKYFYNEGLIFNNKNDTSYITEATHVKKSILTSKPNYWTNPVELIARTVENFPVIEPKIKLDTFKNMVISHIDIVNKEINANLYPSKELYDNRVKFIVKDAVRFMYTYAAEHMGNELTFNKNTQNVIKNTP